MGWIKNAKAATLGEDARKAWDAGSPVFTPILNMPSTNAGLSGRVEDWEHMMAAVLETGWRLHTWAVCSDSRGRPQAQPLCVRP